MQVTFFVPKIMSPEEKRQNWFLHYFWFNRWMLEFCGVLPKENRPFFVEFLLIVLTLSSSSFLVFPGIYTIAAGKVEIEAEEKVNIIGESLEILVGAIKVIALLPCRASMFQISRRMTRLWDQVRTAEDLKIVRPYALRGLCITWGFALNVLFALLSLLVAPAFMRFDYDANGTLVAGKSLPYSAGVLHEDDYRFRLWWALQVPAGFVGIVPIVGIDTATGFFVLHGCAQLRLLRHRMRAIVGDRRRSGIEQANFTKAEYRNMLIDCIHTHQDIIRYCEEVEKTFRMVVLIQMILSITAICGFGFNLLAQEKDRVKYALHLVGAVIQLLIFCWPPDNLQDESMKVAFEAVDLGWYNWRSEDKSLVKFIIMRSQKPLLLTAGKFSRMSLETFTSILSSAFSFFSILRKTL